MFDFVLGPAGNIEFSYYYLVFVIVAQTGVRAFMCALRSAEIVGLESSFWPNWRKDFLSTHPDEEVVKDFWYPTIIGMLELAIYPLLIVAGTWQPIGGWIAIKTAVRWQRWSTNRATYNRFLIGNGLVIFPSLWLTPLIKV